MTDPDFIRDVLGIPLGSERVEQNLKAYADILQEISKLRTLNLSDVHPAVVFSPISKLEKSPNE